MNIFKRHTAAREPEVGKDMDWNEIIGHVLHVVSFDKNGTVLSNGQIKAKSLFLPYGYLTVESPLLQAKARIPLIHRDDFMLATIAYEHPEFAPLIHDAELLITVIPKEPVHNNFIAGNTHNVHYAFAPLGTIKKYYEIEGGKYMENPDPTLIFKHIVHEGEISVEERLDLNF